ncbi:ABC transporter substrate-binding protein [Cupriavidus sp. H39]|uniref:ABC transporter substrate-binding protein n=1 Tax=Cupriavidus sp. H39 TaxID=3401635 RepID=UPI003D055A55
MQASIIKRIGALCLGLGLGCALPATAQVRVGFVGTLSGPGGALGQDQYDAFMLALAHLGGKLGGQPVKVVREDDQLRPDVGAQAVQKLIEKEKVQVITGMTFSNVLLATYKSIVEREVFLIGSNAGPSQMAGAQCSPFFFSTSWQNDEQYEVMGKHVQERGYQRVFLLAPNYQAGKDAVAGFKRYYEGQIADEVYTQVNQPDYAAELAQVQAARPDAVFVFYPGGMGVNFVKQYQQAGLLGKVPLFTGSTLDGTTLPALKDAALGAWSGAAWSPDLNVAANRKFVADFEKTYRRTPSHYAAYSYDAAMLLDSAVRKVGGKLDDKKAFQAALKSADFNSVRGNFRFNSNQFPIADFHALEVVRDRAGQVGLATRKTVFREHRDAYYKRCPLR